MADAAARPSANGIGALGFPNPTIVARLPSASAPEKLDDDELLAQLGVDAASRPEITELGKHDGLDTACVVGLPREASVMHERAAIEGRQFPLGCHELFGFAS